MDDGLLEVTNVGNVTTLHPHVNHSGSLALRNLALGFTLLFRERRGQQAIVILNEVHEQHWSQRVGKSLGLGEYMRLTGWMPILD